MSANTYRQASETDPSSEAVEPPHNSSAEMAVLGALLRDNNAHQRISDFLRPAHFSVPAHIAIFEAIQRLINTGRVADGVTLREYFAAEDTLGALGGAQYLIDLLDSAAFGVEIIDYARLIRDLSMRRDLIDIASSVMQQARSGQKDGDTLIEDAERQLFDLGQYGITSGGFARFGSALADSISMATAAFTRDDKLAGLSTGLDELDHKLGGLHRSDLIVLAGRPSMGKTALATNIAYHAAIHCKRSKTEDGSEKTTSGAVVGFFSLEMSSEQLATRILSDVARIPSHLIRRGQIDQRDFEAIRDAAERIESLPLFIDDTGGISIAQIAARARRLQRTSGLDFLVIDYLQLIAPPREARGDGRVHEISRITQALKTLAKELDIPVLALSQLSRQVELREDKRPQLSDLRESGAIEQDADVVIFVFREAYYLERLEPSQDDPAAHADWKAKMEASSNIAELIISKQRHGPIGRMEVAFDPARVRFGNLDRYGPDARQR